MFWKIVQVSKCLPELLDLYFEGKDFFTVTIDVMSFIENYNGIAEVELQLFTYLIC